MGVYRVLVLEGAVNPKTQKQLQMNSSRNSQDCMHISNNAKLLCHMPGPRAGPQAMMDANLRAEVGALAASAYECFLPAAPVILQRGHADVAIRVPLPDATFPEWHAAPQQTCPGRWLGLLMERTAWLADGSVIV